MCGQAPSLPAAPQRLDRPGTLVPLVDLAPGAPRIGVAIELCHERATVAVTGLLGDHVRGQLQAAEPGLGRPEQALELAEARCSATRIDNPNADLDRNERSSAILS